MSKINLYRKSVTITVGAVDNEACVFKLLKRLLRKFPLSPDVLLFNPGQPFTSALVTSEIRDGIRELDFKEVYVSHSIRKRAII